MWSIERDPDLLSCHLRSRPSSGGSATCRPVDSNHIKFKVRSWEIGEKIDWKRRSYVIAWERRRHAPPDDVHHYYGTWFIYIAEICKSSTDHFCATLKGMGGGGSRGKRDLRDGQDKPIVPPAIENDIHVSLDTSKVHEFCNSLIPAFFIFSFFVCVNLRTSTPVAGISTLPFWWPSSWLSRGSKKKHLN